MIKLLKKILKIKIIKFAIVGGLGTILNLAIFFLFVDILKLNEYIISSLAFVVAATQNYLLNHIWTFKEITANDKVSFWGWTKFMLSSLIGLAINLIVLKITILLFNPEIKVIAQGVGILSGMIVNFIFSKFFVFKKKVAN